MDEDKFRSELAERMQKARADTWGPRQKPLANALKITPSQISRWESGLSMPRVSELVRFAAACNVSVMELLSLDGKRAPTQLLLGLEPNTQNVIVDLVGILRNKTLEVSKLRRRGASRSRRGA